MNIVDAHIHLGPFAEKTFTEEDLKADLAEAGCAGAVVFAFPEDMYRAVDSPERRGQAHEYILEVARRNPGIRPFYFVWRYDEVPDDLATAYKGIKWHRHADEPHYDYRSGAFNDLISLIDREAMPVVLEEEREYTFPMADHLERAPVIIPHCGRLNGGFEGLRPLVERPNIYFDTSVASLEEVRTVLDAVGPPRLIFGSDVSGTATPFFNFSKVEISKLDQLGLEQEDYSLVLGENILRLMARGRRYQLHMEIQLDDDFSSETPAGYSLRTAKPGDEAAWTRIMNGSVGEWTEEEARKGIFGSPVYEPESMFFVVDDSTGRAVGSACLWHNAVQPSHKGTLHMLAVDEAHRGKRLGETLTRAVLRRAREKGRKQIQLTTDDWRLGAIKTYLRLGFEPVHMVRHEDHSERWREVKRRLEGN